MVTDWGGVWSREVEREVEMSSEPVVRQLRLVVEADDFDEAVAFYRDALGLTEEFYVESEGDAREDHDANR